MMEFLAPIIIDFPFQLDVTGDLNASDYESALQTIREWFIHKQSAYEIRRNIF